MARSQPRNYSNLPIEKYRNNILKKLNSHQVVIIMGETGCGKSTQVPKYLHEAGYTDKKKIACLHPRCIAATTLADRVSAELESTTGELVGYAIRFESKSDYDTMIMFVTTGSMVRFIMDDIRLFKGPGKYNDKWVKKYSVIIIDEAHERSIETDIMLGKMKQVMETNKDIKLIIMSATIDVRQFEQYYPGSATVIIKEKMDRVTVLYRPLSSPDYLGEIENLVKEILSKPGNGHILIFLHAEYKVLSCVKKLKRLESVQVLPFFATMDNSEKLKVFKNFQCRKIIVATNAAESGLTIPDLEYVIDSGAVRKVVFNHETWTELWMTKYISIAEAEQRKGRTGRTRPGVCYRLYEESFMRTIDENDLTNDPDYDIEFPFVRKDENIGSSSDDNIDSSSDDNIDSSSDDNIDSSSDESIDISNKYFHQFPEPTIHEADLGMMILMIKSFGYENIMDFPFYVQPYEDRFESAIKQLCNLSLLSPDQTLSSLGKKVRFLPLDPRLGKVAILGSKSDYQEDILIIVSISSVRRLQKTLQKASCSVKKLASVEGDMFRYLNIFKMARSNNFSEKWCEDNFVNYYDINYGAKVLNQLDKILPKKPYMRKHFPGLDVTGIKKTFLSGYFQNIARPLNDNEKEEEDSVKNSHILFNGKKVKIIGGSCLNESTEMVMSQNIHSYQDNEKLNNLVNCINIDQELLLSINPKHLKINENLWKDILKFFDLD